MNTWTENVALLARHINKAVADAKRAGTVAMSRNNLRQIIDTRGITVPPHTFERLFDEAITKSKAAAFLLTP